MLKKTITYTDYNGVERTEDFYFNLSKAEVMEMEMSTTGGLAEMINRIVAAQDAPAIIKIFKDLIETEGVTIVMTTHDTGLMEFGDRVYQLEDGELVG